MSIIRLLKKGRGFSFLNDDENNFSLIFIAIFVILMIVSTEANEKLYQQELNVTSIANAMEKNAMWINGKKSDNEYWKNKQELSIILKWLLELYHSTIVSVSFNFSPVYNLHYFINNCVVFFVHHQSFILLFFLNVHYTFCILFPHNF